MALIGSPLRRTHSAVMHNAAFDHFGIDARYDLVEIAAAELDPFFAAARSDDWLGFQVTAPYKQAAAARCDHVEAAARMIGAVNSVQRLDDATLTGFNTDAPGFARAVFAELDLHLVGAAVAVAGAGGAARAVIHACLEAGARRVVVGARALERAERLLAERGDQRLEAVELGDSFEGVLPEVDLAVNATTVGMTAAGTAFDPARLPPSSAVFDLVYVPPVTELVEAARAAGLAAANGLAMLVAQAEIAFERWTGVAGAGGVMRRALDRTSFANDA